MSKKISPESGARSLPDQVTRPTRRWNAWMAEQLRKYKEHSKPARVAVRKETKTVSPEHNWQKKLGLFDPSQRRSIRRQEKNVAAQEYGYRMKYLGFVFGLAARFGAVATDEQIGLVVQIGELHAAGSTDECKALIHQLAENFHPAMHLPLAVYLFAHKPPIMELDSLLDAFSYFPTQSQPYLHAKNRAELYDAVAINTSAESSKHLQILHERNKLTSTNLKTANAADLYIRAWHAKVERVLSGLSDSSVLTATDRATLSRLFSNLWSGARSAVADKSKGSSRLINNLDRILPQTIQLVEMGLITVDMAEVLEYKFIRASNVKTNKTERWQRLSGIDTNEPERSRRAALYADVLTFINLENKTFSAARSLALIINEERERTLEEPDTNFEHLEMINVLQLFLAARISELKFHQKTADANAVLNDVLELCLNGLRLVHQDNNPLNIAENIEVIAAVSGLLSKETGGDIKSEELEEQIAGDVIRVWAQVFLIKLERNRRALASDDPISRLTYRLRNRLIRMSGRQNHTKVVTARKPTASGSYYSQQPSVMTPFFVPMQEAQRFGYVYGDEILSMQAMLTHWRQSLIESEQITEDDMLVLLEATRAGQLRERFTFITLSWRVTHMIERYNKIKENIGSAGSDMEVLESLQEEFRYIRKLVQARNDGTLPIQFNTAVSAQVLRERQEKEDRAAQLIDTSLTEVGF